MKLPQDPHYDEKTRRRVEAMVEAEQRYLASLQRAGDASGALAERDWRGLVQFVTEHRKSEHATVQKGMKDLRETVWALVSSAHRVAQADASRPVDVHLEKVRAAV